METNGADFLTPSFVICISKYHHHHHHQCQLPIGARTTFDLVLSMLFVSPIE
jgi:hypothetical protein